MEPADKIKELIDKSDVRTTSQTDKRVLGSALEYLEKLKQQKSAPTQPNFWRPITKNPITKIAAAAAVLIVGLLFLIGDGQQTLYARFIRALEQERSLHVVIKEYRDDLWFKDHEMWYDREAGIIEQERYTNRTDFRVDNGEYEWRYAAGGEFVMKLKSYRDNSELVGNLCAEWLRHDPNRVPSGDMVIDGISCEMYVLADGEDTTSIWVDKENRIRQLEGVTQLQDQIKKMRATVEYDIQIDKDCFFPRFGPEVRVISPREWIERQYPLDGALFARECLGLVFAVHEFEACENGVKYLICSDRLSDQTRQNIGSGHPWTFYGKSDLHDSYDETGTYDHPILLGRLTHDGVGISWYLILPSDDKTKRSLGCKVLVGISTANDLAEKNKSEGLPVFEKFRMNITLPKSQERKTGLREIAEQIYKLGEKLDPLVHTFRLTEVVREPDGQKIAMRRKPAVELSEDEYTKNVEGRVKEWLERQK